MSPRVFHILLALPGRDLHRYAIIAEIESRTGGKFMRPPGSSLVAIMTLAFGIGASTAIFSVVDAAMLRPPPYPHPRAFCWAKTHGYGLSASTQQR